MAMANFVFLMTFSVFVLTYFAFYQSNRREDDIPSVLPRASGPAPIADNRGFVEMNGCRVPLWNMVYTTEIPNAKQHADWLKRGLSKEDNLEANLSLIGAFAYKDYMAVTITSQNLFARKTFCRYFDCHRKELQPAFESVVFPEATVYCARRPGASFVSLTHSLDEKPQFPVPVVDRTNPEPRHQFAVCMAPLYGDEPKWLQIVEFIEHYKLQGATYFYVYLINIDPYSRIILDDYIRTGEIEVVHVRDRFERPDWLGHMVEIFDCLQRSKYDSKWTAFVDIDERMTTNNGTVADFLSSINDDKVGSLTWRSQWVLKTGDVPPRFINKKQLMEEMIFRKYTNTSAVGPAGHTQKCIIRSEMVGVMSIHWPTLYPGFKEIPMPPELGATRHYRNVKMRVFGKGWEDTVSKFGKMNVTRLPAALETAMVAAVTDRVEFVYDMVALDCHRIAGRVWGGHGLRNPCDEEKERKEKKEAEKEKQEKNN